MSHTTRIYNNPRIKKAQRYNIDNQDDIEHILGTHTSQQVGIPLTKRSWICMGKCPMCRDHNKETYLVRKRMKDRLRFELTKEIGVCSCKKS